MKTIAVDLVVFVVDKRRHCTRPYDFDRASLKCVASCALAQWQLVLELTSNDSSLTLFGFHGCSRTFCIELRTKYKTSVSVQLGMRIAIRWTATVTTAANHM
jgi:hypothetical protein